MPQGIMSSAVAQAESELVGGRNVSISQAWGASKSKQFHRTSSRRATVVRERARPEEVKPGELDETEVGAEEEFGAGDERQIDCASGRPVPRQCQASGKRRGLTSQRRHAAPVAEVTGLCQAQHQHQTSVGCSGPMGAKNLTGCGLQQLHAPFVPAYQCFHEPHHHSHQDPMHFQQHKPTCSLATSGHQAECPGRPGAVPQVQQQQQQQYRTGRMGQLPTRLTGCTPVDQSARQVSAAAAAAAAAALRAADLRHFRDLAAASKLVARNSRAAAKQQRQKGAGHKAPSSAGGGVGKAATTAKFISQLYFLIHLSALISLLLHHQNLVSSERRLAGQQQPAANYEPARPTMAGQVPSTPPPPAPSMQMLPEPQALKAAHQNQSDATASSSQQQQQQRHQQDDARSSDILVRLVGRQHAKCALLYFSCYLLASSILVLILLWLLRLLASARTSEAREVAKGPAVKSSRQGEQI